MAALASAGCNADASLRDGLVADVLAVDQASWARPSHVPSPTPGTFGDAAEVTVAWLLHGIEPLAPAEVLLANPPAPAPPPSSRCDDFVKDGFADRSISLGCIEESAARARQLAPLLEATHAAAAGLPPSLRGTDPSLTLPRSRAMFMALRDLEIEARVALASRRPGGALATCVDRLALVRDLTWGGLLLEDTIGQTSIAQVLTTCSVAADRVSLDRRALADALEAVQEGMPPFVHIARRETALIEVRAWGVELGEDERERLPPSFRDEVRPSDASRDDWAAFRAHWKAAEAAMSLASAEERRLQMVDLDGKTGDRGPQWAHYLALHDRHVAAIGALVWALRTSLDDAGKPTPPLPAELAPFTEIGQPYPEQLVVTVTTQTDPERKIALQLRLPKHSASAP